MAYDILNPAKLYYQIVNQYNLYRSIQNEIKWKEVANFISSLHDFIL